MLVGYSLENRSNGVGLLLGKVNTLPIAFWNTIVPINLLKFLAIRKCLMNNLVDFVEE